MADSPQVVLRATKADDLDFVLDLEAREDYVAFILRWPREKHLAALDDVDLRHLMICSPEGESLGYAILAGPQAGAGSIELLRIALARPGRGIGAAALAALSAYAFEALGARRFWLDVFEDNSRARRAYRRAGFLEESGPRQVLERAGTAMPLVVMSMERRAFGKDPNPAARADS